MENIPGLYFIGNQRKPNFKIKVEHVVEDTAQDVSGAVEENKFEDLSVTDSTTSNYTNQCLYYSSGSVQPAAIAFVIATNVENF